MESGHGEDGEIYRTNEGTYNKKIIKWNFELKQFMFIKSTVLGCGGNNKIFVELHIS